MRNVCIAVFITIAAVSMVRANDWYVEGGGVYRKSLTLELRADSLARQGDMQAAEPASSEPSPSEPSGTLLDDPSDINQNFDDGYVYEDAFTALFGNTGNWSFDDMSQYDAEAGTLTFHVSSETWQSTDDGFQRTITTDTDAAIQGEAEDGVWGAGLRGGRMLVRRETYWVASQVGLNVYEEMNATVQGVPYEQTVTTEYHEAIRTVQENWTYTYDASFEGAELVDSRPPGTTGAPYLPVTPLDSELTSVDDDVETRLLSRTQRRAAASVRLDADIQLVQMTVGPRFGFEVSPRVTMGGFAYASLNAIDLSATRYEVFAWENGEVIGDWQDSESETTWACGGGAEVSLMVRAAERLSVTVSGGYDAVFDEPDLTVGPDEVKTDLDSWTLGVLIGVAL